ncbi:uncharacterized mitochondrial protein-like protein [Tanacetum coccineum]
MVPRAVLIKSGLVSVNTARQVNVAHTKTTVNAARSMSHLSKIAHSTIKRSIHKNTTFKNNNFNQRVNTVKDKNVNTAKPKAVVNAARPKAISYVVKGNNTMKKLMDDMLPLEVTLKEGKSQAELTDESQVLLKVPRKNNMYSVDLNNIIPNGGSGPNWLFDIDALTKSMNYKPVVAGNQSNGNAGTKACDDAGKARMETVPGKDYILLPLWTADSPFSQSSKSSQDDRSKPQKSLCTEFKKMMHKKFQMSSMGELTFLLELQVKQKEDGIFISQDKYVTEILKKFGFTDVKTASTPMETQKLLLKDEDVIRARYQVLKRSTKIRPLVSKRFSFNLVAYTDSDYAGTSLDRKSTIGGCQFLGSRLISWQCKKQTVVTNSTTEAEYVAASSCCGQELWI